MFADSLLGSGTHLSRRSWTTAASFALQVLGLGVLLLLPLIYTEGLPQLRLMEPFIALTAPAGAPPLFRTRAVGPTTQSNMMGETLLPRQIPQTVAHVSEDSAPPQIGVGVPWGTNDRAANNSIINQIVRAIPIAVFPPAAVARAPRPSHMMEGNLVYQVQPDYPPLARQARIQGRVVLQALISKAGTIENLVVLSGHPVLVRAAIDAVQRWRYRPYYLNGEPIEVETQVTVNFVLSGG